MKKNLVKIVACGAVIALGVGVLCSCAPLYSRVGEMFRSISHVRENTYEEGSLTEEKTNRIFNNSENINEVAEQVFAEADQDDEEWAVNTLEEYERFGISYDEVNGLNWFEGKPMAGFYDKGYNTVISAPYTDIGIFVIVERDLGGNVKSAYATDKENFKKMSETDGIRSGKAAAEDMGYSFMHEDKSVAGLNQTEFTKLENELRMKYRGQNIMVECKDYVFYFDKECILSISSFCASDVAEYGARAYVNYRDAEGINLDGFDSDKTDLIIMDVLAKHASDSHTSYRNLEKSIKEAVAKAYGIDEKHVIIDLAEL